MVGGVYTQVFLGGVTVTAIVFTTTDMYDYFTGEEAES